MMITLLAAMICVLSTRASVEPQTAPSQATQEQADFAMEEASLDHPVDVTTQPCLLHAHSMPFWVFIETQDGYVLVLKDSVQLLHVLQTQLNGHRDIETSISTTLGRPTWRYEFDGHQYKLFRKTTVAP